MCTYNITVDEAALRRLHPSFSREAFGRWLQRHVDDLIESMTAEQHPDCRILQGEAMGRPSVVAVHLAADGNIYVGGPAAIVAQGELHI